jgi:3-hydroxybutyryl-CoA dehydrogenase
VSEVERVGVLGAGTMGAGIAQLCARAGIETLLCDANPDALGAGLARIESSLARAVERGRSTEAEAAATRERVRPAASVEELAGVELAVEVVPEIVDLKAQLLSALAQLPGEPILASNTSSISITRLGAATSRPQRVIGMHYFNPVPVMKLVEIIRGLATSDETYAAVHALAVRHGKTPLGANDFPGFISNRVLCPMLNEAVYALYEGVGTIESIDGVMKLGMNHPMGPFELADFIGLDTVLAIMEVLHRGFGDSKYRPCPLLRNYVSAGWLGRKTGRGFYDYASGSAAAGPPPNGSTKDARAARPG